MRKWMRAKRSTVPVVLVWKALTIVSAKLW
jgi:hypothetical protein